MNETEIQRLLVRLTADNESLVKQTQEATKTVNQFEKQTQYVSKATRGMDRALEGTAKRFSLVEGVGGECSESFARAGFAATMLGDAAKGAAPGLGALMSALGQTTISTGFALRAMKDLGVAAGSLAAAAMSPLALVAIPAVVGGLALWKKHAADTAEETKVQKERVKDLDEAMKEYARTMKTVGPFPSGLPPEDRVGAAEAGYREAFDQAELAKQKMGELIALGQRYAYEEKSRVAYSLPSEVLNLFDREALGQLVAPDEEAVGVIKEAVAEWVRLNRQQERAKGLMDEMRDWEAFMKPAFDAMAADEAAEKVIKDLEKQNYILQNGADAWELYNLAAQGAEPALIDAARGLQESNRALQESATEWETWGESVMRGLEDWEQEEEAYSTKLRELGRQVTEQYATPMEKYQKTIADLNELLKADAIGLGTYQRAVAGAAKTLQQATMGSTRTGAVQAIRAGSAEDLAGQMIFRMGTMTPGRGVVNPQVNLEVPKPREDLTVKVLREILLTLKGKSPLVPADLGE